MPLFFLHFLAASDRGCHLCALGLSISQQGRKSGNYFRFCGRIRGAHDRFCILKVTWLAMRSWMLQFIRFRMLAPFMSQFGDLPTVRRLVANTTFCLSVIKPRIYMVDTGSQAHHRLKGEQRTPNGLANPPAEERVWSLGLSSDHTLSFPSLVSL